MVFSGHVPRKRFAQHWLKDQSVLDQIIASADLSSIDRVIETKISSEYFRAVSAVLTNRMNMVFNVTCVMKCDI